MKRREFLASLKSLATLAACGAIPGVTLLPSFARAAGSVPAAAAKKYFVMVRAYGGWDVTLGLDPKEHANGSEQSDMFIEYRPDQIIGSPSLRLGPAGAPLLPYLNDIAVINGIVMSDFDVNHDSNFDYITTGSEMGAADLAVELGHASEMGPFGIIFNSKLKSAGRKILPTTLNHLELFRNSVDLGKVRGYIDGARKKSAFYNAQKQFIKTAPYRAKLIEAFDALAPEMQNTGGGGNGNGAEKPAQRLGAIVAAAFASGSAYQAQLDLNVEFDTHSGHAARHAEAQLSAFTGLAHIFRIFKSIPVLSDQGEVLGSLFDHTTFAMVSEFSRTPALNAAGGKDHNPMTNSVLLAGGNVRGGQSFGASTLVRRRSTSTGEPRHTGALIDFDTNLTPRSQAEARESNFQFVTPVNVASTIADLVGVDRSRFANAGADAVSIKRLIKRV